jgi:hypothetical protein
MEDLKNVKYRFLVLRNNHINLPSLYETTKPMNPIQIISLKINKF